VTNPTGPTPARRVYAVGALLAGINGLLQDRVGRVWVQGEVSNLHRAASGHAYFTLKDDRGQLRAALFRGAAGRLRFELEEGMEVIVSADVGVYEARGDLQLIVKNVEPVGLGALQLAFEQLRRKLEGEGLFDESRKKPLPPLPERIGVVTSPTSAAVRDIIQVSARRFPAAVLLISPTRVQGNGAELEIAAAIDALASREDLDLVIVARGGGSLEDLWCFNSVEVARSIERCPVPLISGVGHETDVTICDLVADVRAPTPSAAAEIALPDRFALMDDLERKLERLLGAMTWTLDRGRSRLEKERVALRMLAPTARLAARRARLRSASRGLGRLGRSLADLPGARLSALASRLDSLSPLALLDRGYAVVRGEADGAILRRASDVSVGDRLVVQLAAVQLRARVEDIEE
jgi:exodeoxyribonuclease VII large subunit